MTNNIISDDAIITKDGIINNGDGIDAAVKTAIMEFEDHLNPVHFLGLGRLIAESLPKEYQARVMDYCRNRAEHYEVHAYKSFLEDVALVLSYVEHDKNES